MTDPRARLQETLSGNYTIERELGGGGMSRVYLAQETALGRTVVIKVIAPDLAEGLSAERFAREVKLAARLQQANIVPVLTAGQAGGLPFYTMPFVKGESLRARLSTGTPLPPAEAISLLRDVARALAYAHGEGVVHRDIKPENILMSGGAAVVTDFGIAKALDASRTQESAAATITQSGNSIGTPAYMAPEQARGALLADARSDVYAVGALLYRLATGFTPYEPGDPSTTLGRVLSEDPRPPRDLAPDLPIAVEAVVQRAMARDPSLRFESMEALASALDAIASSFERSPRTLPESGRAAEALVREARLARPLAASAALGAALVAALATAATIGTWIPHPGTDEGRLLVAFAALVGGLGVGLTLARDLSACWRSAPACLAQARQIARSLFAGLLVASAIELATAGSAALRGEAAPGLLATRFVLAAMASLLVHAFVRRAASRGA